MKSLIFALVAMFSMNVFAEPVCDFPYDLSEDEGVTDLRTIVVTPATRLTSLQKAQVITTAKRYANSAPRTMTLPMAIKELMRYSEAGDVFITIFKFKNTVYSIVEHYPGGTSLGLVFKGTKIVAERSDGDLNCTGF